jgi:ABC-type transporter Mla MlaB component
LFRIDEIRAEELGVTLALSGALTADYVAETQARIAQLQQRCYAVQLDLTELRHVDRAGIAFLLWAARGSIPLLHLAPYVLTWLKQEYLHGDVGSTY